jgi:hypothetical protein
MRIEAFFSVFSRVMAAQEAPPGLRQARPMINSAPSLAIERATQRFLRVNEETTYRRILHRSGTSARRLHEFKTTLRICPAASESPLSDPVASCLMKTMGIVMSGLFDDVGGRAVHALGRSC